MKRFLSRFLSLAFGKRIALTNDPVVGRATAASGCSPVRLSPAIGVMTGAHYRISIQELLHPQKSADFRGPRLGRAYTLHQ